MSAFAELLKEHPVVPYIRGGEYAVRTPWYIPERRLLDYLLIYFQEGQCTIEVDGKEYRFASGEFCLIQPDCVHTLRGVTNTITPYAHLDFFYNPDRGRSFMTRPGQVDLTEYAHLLQPTLDRIAGGVRIPVRLQLRNPLQFRDLMLRMIECWLSADPLRMLEAHSIAMQLIVIVLKDHCSSAQDSAPTIQSFNWITSYFAFRLSEPLSVADMAQRANLSPSRFNVLFKRQFGMPPHRYLLELRLNHAMDLLKTTALSLSDIGEYCGFADIHHFSKVFKKETGMAPGLYRKMKGSGPAAVAEEDE